MNRTVIGACILAAAFVLAGCSKRQQEWETARTADTIESYQGFLKAHPDGEFVSQAQARVRELEEARDWQQAIMTDTPEGYQQFLNKYPEGRMSDEARIRIENFALAQTPSTTLPPETPQEPAAVAEENIETKVVASGKGYRVQLGAFTGGEKQAMGEWRRLRQEYPKYLGSLSPSVKLATTTSGHVYRLQAGMTNEGRAREICAALKTKGQACVVVKP